MMDLFLTRAIYITIQSLPAHLLCYYPVRGQLRLSRSCTALAVCCCLLAQAVLYGWLGSNWVEYAFAPVFLAVYIACVRLDVYRLLFFYVTTASYALAAKGLAVFVQARLPGESKAFAMMGLYLVVVLLTMPLMVYMLKQTGSRILHIEAPFLWKTIWLAPGLTIAIALIFTWDIRSDMTGSVRFLLARVLVPGSTLAIYSLLIRSLDAVQACAVAEALGRQQEQLALLQRNQYAQLQRHVAQVQQARHDLRQHLNLISAYLDRGDEAALRDYIAAYGKTLPQDTGTHYCANIAVDTIIRYYAQEAGQYGVSFRACAALPARLGVSEPDMCALLGNLLENALDACRTQPAGQTYIQLRLIQQETAIAVTVDNPCPQKPRQEKDGLISAKTGQYGIGTQSVRAIAAQYRGMATFEWKQGTFCASVLLQLPKLGDEAAAQQT